MAVGAAYRLHTSTTPLAGHRFGSDTSQEEVSIVFVEASSAHSNTYQAAPAHTAPTPPPLYTSG